MKNLIRGAIYSVQKLKVRVGLNPELSAQDKSEGKAQNLK